MCVACFRKLGTLCGFGFLRARELCAHTRLLESVSLYGFLGFRIPGFRVLRNRESGNLCKFTDSKERVSGKSFRRWEIHMGSGFRVSGTQNPMVVPGSKNPEPLYGSGFPRTRNLIGFWVPRTRNPYSNFVQKASKRVCEQFIAF